MTNKKRTSNKILGTILLIVIVLSSGGLYLHTLDAEFHLDDDSIYNNALITDVRSIPVLMKAEPHRFIAYLTFMVNYSHHELEVAGYHIVNIILHIINSLLVFLLMAQTIQLNRTDKADSKRQDILISFFCALLFAVHPLQTQAVTYIVQRLASLATLFYLAAMCSYLAMKKQPKELSYKKVLLGMGVLVFFTLGIFTKEIIYTLPVMILIYEIMFFKRGNLKDFIRAKKWWGLFFLALGGFILMKFDLSIILSPKVTPDFVTVDSGQYFLTQLTVIWKYIRLLFFPIGQNIDHHIPIVRSLFEPHVMASLIGLLLLLMGTIWIMRRNQLVALGMIWFFVTLAIESTIIPLEDVMFEHRLYLPMVGFALAFVKGVSDATGRNFKRTGIALLVLVTLFFSILTYHRNNVWRTGLSLWSDAVAKSPKKARPYYNLGNAYKREGKITEAIENYTHTLKLSSRYANAYHARGIAHRIEGNLQIALDDFNKAITIEPANVKYILNRAETYRRMGQMTNALEDYATIIAMAPDTVEAYIDRGTIQMEGNRLEGAIADFNRAQAITPNDFLIYNNRGLAFLKKGEKDKALADLSKAIQLKRNLPLAYYTRGTIYREYQQYDQALTDFTQAIQLNPEYYQAFNDRGIVLAEQGKFEQAIRDFNTTLNLNPKFTSAYRNRGIAFGRMGNEEQAEKDISKSKEMR